MSADRQFSKARLTPFLADISPGLYVSSGRAIGRGGSYGDALSGYSYSTSSRRGRSLSAASLNEKSKALLKNVSALCQGQAVLHPFFGRGIIDKVTGEHTVEVVFDRHGRKTLHLDYAKLEIIK
jgi:DNA helicase-2/ATP-dependent DNA helicase PcrA